MGKHSTTAENNKFERLFSTDEALAVAVTVRDESKQMLPLEKRYGVEPPQRRRIHRVPPQLRRRNENRREYDPTIVSLGPYHHGQPELRAAEEVKHRFLDRLASGSGNSKTALHGTILARIGEFRAYYADDKCVDKFDDRELATMMLLDACLMVALMEGLAGDSDVFLFWHQCLGIATLQFAFPDLMLLENQLPFPALSLIVNLRRGKEGAGLINSFLNWFLTGDFKPQICSKSDGVEELPLHLLEACHRMLVGSKSPTQKISGLKFTNPERDITTRSVMDLKSKGIEVTASSSCSIRDIKFIPGAFQKAELQLPTRMVWSHALSTLSNVIAYEMSPGTASEFEVLSYANFMKALTESVEDAKELQEKGIFINRFQNQQQLVEELRGVDTFGMDNLEIFKEVKVEIEEHCKSKAKTWMADLIHTFFASPWTVIALFAAIILLCLTLVQTYFTINPLT
ncbi:UPF0481 protein At3g47200-like [Salvia miltiorrhiza]|uniref:UPF0481 protein At3g47200-like n=1 Tax=Salvia miltiorrhiza TaxID=226208 RepID=UPI0025ABD7E5|nr:UPF0481 protein At3g47200-like [Salvia miltiorrhiza]